MTVYEESLIFLKKKKERKKIITKELKLNLKLCMYVSTLIIYLKVIKMLII